ncbi:CHC2 zinc finger domain-containing protein [Pseudomonadota bacterium]
MARIAEQEIERLKNEISLVRLVESQGYTLKKEGKDFSMCCPFHEDKTPSLKITPAKNLFNCFGCGAAGSVIDWVMRTQGLSFRHAVEVLKEGDVSSLAARTDGPVKRSTVTKLPTPLANNAEDQAQLKQVVDYYHQTLKQSPEAIAYLDKRGLSAEAIDYFKLGMANRTLSYRLPEKNRKEGAAIRGQLQRIGILRNTGHEHFNGSLVVPIINDNQVLEMYGRKITPKLRKGTPLHLYLPGPHEGVFNPVAFKASKEIILCESIIDALTFWCAGFRNVTTSYGTNGFTPELLKAFQDHGTERVLIAYDRDNEGERAASELAEKLITEGVDCYRILFPKGMDANEYALQVQPASKSLGVVIRSAKWLGNGKQPTKPKTTETLQIQVQDEPNQEVEPSFLVADLAAEEAEEQEEDEALIKAPEPVEPLPAAAIPEPPSPEVQTEVKDDEAVMMFGNRRYRVRGINKNLSFNQLKVNILVNQGEALHVDTFDLYAAKARGQFIRQAAVELGLKDDLIKADLGKALLKLESLQEENIKRELEPKSKEVVLEDHEKAQAMALLKSPNLMQRILEDFNTAGVVGEEVNKHIGYLAAVSRKLDKPLAIIIQSTSAAGKSSLMDAILNMIPEEERVQYSAMTGQSLFYMGETNLKNKILAIAEEEGAENASYALKLLQSEGELTIASTGKDESTGTLVTKEYRVEGPVMLFLTTTAIDIDEELMNRCLVLTVNESREQTQAIHAMQRKQQTLEGLLQNEDRKHIIQLHRNAQRLLKPLLVANPFAEQLTFIDDKTRTRRDHMKYLTLIRSIALLHQYQREVKTIVHHGQRLDYIEVTLDDIEIANHLAHEVLGRTLEELPPQTCNLLKKIKAMVEQACNEQSIKPDHYRFTRRDVRLFSGWTDFQIKKHMARLQELEYVLVHRGSRGQSFVYELLYDGDLNDNKHLMGLIDVETLRYDEKKKPLKTNKEPSSSPQVAAKVPPSSPSQKALNPSATNDLEEDEAETPQNTYIAAKSGGESYRSDSPSLVAKGS